MPVRERPLEEITLRKYEKPFGLEGRELTRKFCLSLGLLQPGDGRDGIVDVLHVVAHSKKPLDLTELSKQALAFRKAHNLPAGSVSPSNVRRHLRRLKHLYLIEKKHGGYAITEGDSLAALIDARLTKYVLASTTERIKEYAIALDRQRMQ
jgi:DNA-binding transcriptional ArsR family regulator